MTTPWIKILQSLDNEYDALSRSLQEGPYIEPKLVQIDADIWSVRLDEIWPTNFAVVDSYRLDERLNWASTELEKWPKVSRSDWNSWIFHNHRDAERFLILYNLKWNP